MIYHITKGIKISVKTVYNNTSNGNGNLYHSFSYQITIENNSEDAVKLTNRFWKIFDSLNKTEIVKGTGVVGQQPILQPNQGYTYNSGCYLTSTIGAMKGYYTMLNLNTLEEFKVTIPTFQLTTPVLLN